jgi:threonine dehydratase
MELKQSVLNAQQKINRYICETPLEPSPYLSKIGKCRVWLKCENIQTTGSFKLRGAANKLLSLKTSELSQVLVTASSGNHGNAFAFLVKMLGLSGRIVLAENASPAKVEALRYWGTKIELYGNDCVEAECFARESAAKRGEVFISPYNDPDIIVGQGTVGVDIKAQMELFSPGNKTDAVLVPVGGGGLISGIAGYLKSVDKRIEMIGCQPENSAVMYESMKAGRIISQESKPTVSDGTAGGIEPGSITFELCQQLVDDMLLVSESEIIMALQLILERHHLLVEGAGALTVAAFLKNITRFKKKNVVLVLSGRKIGFSQLKEILC